MVTTMAQISPWTLKVTPELHLWPPTLILQVAQPCSPVHPSAVHPATLTALSHLHRLGRPLSPLQFIQHPPVIDMNSPACHWLRTALGLRSRTLTLASETSWDLAEPWSACFFSHDPVLLASFQFLKSATLWVPRRHFHTQDHP